MLCLSLNPSPEERKLFYNAHSQTFLNRPQTSIYQQFSKKSTPLSHGPSPRERHTFGKAYKVSIPIHYPYLRRRKPKPMIMRKHLLSTLAVFALLLTLTPAANAQIRVPSASPTATFSTTVGLTDVSIEYSRPSMRGRTIFAEDGLVPFGEVWRTGANSATKITFADNVMVGEEALNAGSYAILTVPAADMWAIHFFPYDAGNWNTYLEAEAAAIVKAAPSMLNHSMETFTISINHQSMDGAHLIFAWDKTAVAVPIKVEVKERVMSNISRVMNGPSANDYYAAAGFIYDTEGDMEDALKYMKKAVELTNDSPRYWYLRRLSLIYAATGDKAGAVESATRSLELAQEAGNMDYVRMNENSIREWGGR